MYYKMTDLNKGNDELSSPSPFSHLNSLKKNSNNLVCVAKYHYEVKKINDKYITFLVCKHNNFGKLLNAVSSHSNNKLGSYPAACVC